MLWMSHPHLFWSLWRETSHIWIVPRISFSKTRSDQHPRAFSGSMKVMGGGGSSSWLYGMPGVIFIHFLNTICFFLIASQLKFKRCPPASPSPVTPGGCCLLHTDSLGSLAFATYGFPSLKLKQIGQQPLTTAQVSAKLVLSPGNGKDHMSWAPRSWCRSGTPPKVSALIRNWKAFLAVVGYP